MQTQSLDTTPPMQPTGTIAEARARDYAGYFEEFQAHMRYVDQLAMMTTTNIDAWSITVFSRTLTLVSLRRDINKVFFAEKERREKDGVAALTLEAEKTLAAIDAEQVDAQKERLNLLQANLLGYQLTARRSWDEGQANIDLAWNAKKQINALEKQSPQLLSTMLKEVLSEGFWEFHEYRNGMLSLKTKTSVILCERNAAAGVNLTVDMGRYIGLLNVNRMEMTAKRFERNLIYGGIYHPYINSSGKPCWGESAREAANTFSEGGLKRGYQLLQGLLTTYTPTATPYAYLCSFADATTRYNAADALPEVCEICEEMECDCCSRCERTSDECDCCSRCERTSDECDCCSRCERSSDRCDCCHHCESIAENCTCCNDCGRNSEVISGRGHSSTCSNYPARHTPPGNPESPTPRF